MKGNKRERRKNKWQISERATEHERLLTLGNRVEVPQRVKIDLPYDPAIALLGIYPKDTDAVKRRDTCTPMFIAAMSTIAKLWKEPRCPSKDEWIKKMWLCIQWNIPQPLETTNTHHLLQRG